MNDEKLDNNIVRARSMVFEYAMCNGWDYFVTLTIDPAKHDRHDLKGWVKKLSTWLKNYSQRKLPDGSKLRYLLVPEPHKDGAWHMHGFFRGLPPSHLVANEHGYLDWPAYRKAFGYISFSVIKDHEKCARYVSKYISKEMTQSCRELNSQLYYVSKGLQVAETIGKNLVVEMDKSEFDYHGQWCDVKWIGRGEPILCEETGCVRV